MAEDLSKALESAAKLAAQKGLVRFTRFLDPAQAAKAQEIAREQGARLDCWGGYDGAERVIACFYPHGMEPDRDEYPICCLNSRFSSKFCSLSHRDLLGAFMALGLTRACIGDIIIEGEDIFLFATQQTAAFIAESMTSAGKASLRFEPLSVIPPMPAPKGTRFSAVVSSLRLDAVVAAAYRLSRADAADAIRAGLVKLDHLPCERVDATVGEGSLLSLRARGRIRLISLDGMTRKQRIGITFFRYE